MSTIDEQIDAMDLVNYAEQEMRIALQRIAELESAIHLHRENYKSMFSQAPWNFEYELWAVLDSERQGW